MVFREKKSSVQKIRNFLVIFFFLFVFSFGVFALNGSNFTNLNYSIFNESLTLNESIVSGFDDLIIYDANGNKIDAEIEIIDINFSEKSLFSFSRKNVLVKPRDSVIKQIYFEDVDLENNKNFIKIDYPPIKDYLQFYEIYAIDPSEFDFVEAEVLAEARGNVLVKCETWDFEKRECLPICEYDSWKKDIVCHSGWKKLSSVEAGKEYSFILTPQDPAFATYNSSYGAPTCNNYSSPCIAYSSDLQCAGDQANPGPEPNQPNTVDSCVDSSTVGTCHSDESVENITIETYNGSIFNAGDSVRINATWYCYDGASDRVGFFYSSDISSPNWQALTSGTFICPMAGYYSAGFNFNLENVSGAHVVRAIISYNADITSSCPGSSTSYTDQDDLVFLVAPPNTAPKIELNLPSDSFLFSDVQNINFNFTAIDDFTETLNCSIYLDGNLNSTNSSVVNNTLTNFLIEGISYGGHNWSINCSDGLLRNVSEVRAFWINDTHSPKYFNVSKNESVVNNGDYVKFNSNWTDNVLLVGYIFSTNDSGSWVNSSYQEFSGITNVSESVLEINSIAGEWVGWYFWANDSYGNSNATPIQTFVVENISTSLLFSINQTTYPQGTGIYEGYIQYIPFQARYLDSEGNPIENATCVVTNDETSEEVSLVYNESTGNYTGEINNYGLHGKVNFNVSCSKDNYKLNENSTFAYVVAYAYLWELGNLSYGSNSYNSRWLKRNPAENSEVYVYEKNISTSFGENFVESFPSFGLGKNNSLLRDYSALGNKTLRLNMSLNDSSCSPLLKISILDYNLSGKSSFSGEVQTIIVDTPTLIETYVENNFTVQQGNYVNLDLYLNCSSSVSEKVNIYYNYSGQDANMEIPDFDPSEITGQIVAFYNDLENPLVGPNEKLNITNYINFSLNNTNDESTYMEYHLVLPILSDYPNSLIENTTYIYNSTGELLASDNESAGAPNLAKVSSDNIVSWFTEVIPANIAVVEVGRAKLREQIRDDEMLVLNSSGVVQWNISVYSISTVEFGNLEVWTNYSTYGVDNNSYNFNITKTRRGEIVDFTNNFSLDGENKTMTFPRITTSDDESVFLVTATDIENPVVYLVSPDDNLSTNVQEQNFTCNISDISIGNLSFYLWNSSSLVYNETTNLSGTNNESNFSYSFMEDGNYFWNCLGVDSQGNYGWGEGENYSLSYDSTGPSVVINSPLNQTYNESLILVNLSSNGESIWYDWNGTNFSYSGTVSVDFNRGPQTLFVYSNDSLGNLGGENVSFEIIDNISPNWSNLQKNESVVNNGDYVKFNSTWTDNVLLVGYIFSTNDSGSWVNSSYQEFSGITNVSESVLEINSIAGEWVGWYFWANDSYGNSNATPIQTFVVENISTSLLFSINQTTYPQGEGEYAEQYKVNIPFQTRYLDSEGNPIENATCVVTNDKTNDETSLSYNESIGNYTGQINNYEMYGLTTFNVTCSKTNYRTSENSTSANVITHVYLWELNNLNYGSNSINSHWLRRKPTIDSNVYSLKINKTTSVGENHVVDFPSLGLGKNYSFLRNYNAIGNKTLRLNLSINDTSCNPLLGVRVLDFDLNEINSFLGDEQSISANSPTLVETYLIENLTLQQSNYVTLSLYLNCSSAVSEEINIYYNYSGEPVNLEVPEFSSTEITGQIVAFYDDVEEPLIGPGERLNVTEYINFSLTNKADFEQYTKYFLILPILSKYTNSLVPNTTYVYNSTGGLLASDNESAEALGEVTITSNNIASWFTEVIPANTTVIENGRSLVKDLIRNDEGLVSDSSGVVQWNISVYSISTVEFGNLEVWTNYSTYGVDNNSYSFNITKTRRGEIVDFTNNFSLDGENKTMTFPRITTSSDESVFLVTATDIENPVVYLVSPDDNLSTNVQEQNFTCNISDISIGNLSFYLWNSSSLVYNETTNLSGTNNESNFSYSFMEDGNYFWNCLGVDSQGNYGWSERGNYSLTYDSTGPSVVINSPLNQTYNSTEQLVNITSDGGNTWYNWNGTNISYSGAVSVDFNRGPQTLFVYSNDSLSNLNVSSVTFYVNSTGPIINGISVSPLGIVNGSNVTFFVNASNYDYIWTNVSIPGLGVEKINLNNLQNYSFENTSTPGRYAVSFYANDSFGISNSRTEYFESFLPFSFSFNLVDYQGTGINSTIETIYRNSVIGVNSGSGNYTNIVPKTIGGIRIKSYANRIQITLEGLNFSNENDKIFGIDKLVIPATGYLATYGINNSYNFTNATVRIYYDDLSSSYSSENNLKFYKCFNYSFENRSCLSSWEDISSSSLQNKEEDYFEYNTSSFSGFSINEITLPSQNGGGSSGGSSISLDVEEETFFSDLFNLSFKLKKEIIKKFEKLVLLVNYENLTNESVNVQIFYRIFNNSNHLIYSEEENFTIFSFWKGEKIFPNLNLGEGDYVLKILVFENNEFVEYFEFDFKVKSEVFKITEKIVESYWKNIYLFFIVAVFILVILILLIILKLNKKKKKQRQKKRKTLEDIKKMGLTEAKREVKRIEKELVKNKN